MHPAFTVHKDLLLPLFHPYICLADGQSGAGCPYFIEGETEALCLVSTRVRIRGHLGSSKEPSRGWTVKIRVIEWAMCTEQFIHPCPAPLTWAPHLVGQAGVCIGGWLCPPTWDTAGHTGGHAKSSWSSHYAPSFNPDHRPASPTFQAIQECSVPVWGCQVTHASRMVFQDDHLRLLQPQETLRGGALTPRPSLPAWACPSCPAVTPALCFETRCSGLC